MPAGGREIGGGYPSNVARVATVRDAGIPSERREPFGGGTESGEAASSNASEALRAGRSHGDMGQALSRLSADVAGRAGLYLFRSCLSRAIMYSTKGAMNNQRTIGRC